MKTARALSGFGDAIYLRAGVEWLLDNRPDEYVVYTNYREVFQDLDVKVVPFDRGVKVDYDFNYLYAKRKEGTTQFQDMCYRAGIGNIPYTSRLRGRKPAGFVLASVPYAPMGAAEGGDVLRPTVLDFLKVLQAYDKVVVLKQDKYRFLDLVSIVNKADLFIAQVGWGVALGELLGVPMLVLYTERGLGSSDYFYATITPDKTLENKVTSDHLVLP